MAQTSEGGSDLGIEEGTGQGTQGVVEDLEIFATGMQDLDHGGIVQQGSEGGEIFDRQGIDQDHVFAITDLQQSELGVEGALANEFGIDGEGRPTMPTLAPTLQVREIVDPVPVDGRGGRQAAEGNLGSRGSVDGSSSGKVRGSTPRTRIRKVVESGAAAAGLGAPSALFGQWGSEAIPHLPEDPADQADEGAGSESIQPPY